MWAKAAYISPAKAYYDVFPHLPNVMLLYGVIIGETQAKSWRRELHTDFALLVLPFLFLIAQADTLSHFAVKVRPKPFEFCPYRKK